MREMLRIGYLDEAGTHAAAARPTGLPTEFVSAPITPLAGRHLISHRAPATYNRSGCNGSGRVASPAERLLFVVALQG